MPTKVEEQNSNVAFYLVRQNFIGTAINIANVINTTFAKTLSHSQDRFSRSLQRLLASPSWRQPKNR